MRAASFAATIVLLASTAQASTHPHLLFKSTDISNLQSKASGTHAALAQPFLNGVHAMLGTAPPGPNDYGDPDEAADILTVLAMAAVLAPDAAHIQEALAYLDRYLSWSDWDYGQGIDMAEAHFIWSTALAYDWLYPQLTDSEKSAVTSRLTTECDTMLAAVNGQGWWSAEYMQNHNWTSSTALGVCALALEGDVAAAKTDAWRAAALADLQNVASNLNAIVDGSWHEGPGYLSGGLTHLVPLLEMYRQLKGVDLTDLGILHGLGAYRSANWLPWAPRHYLIDDGDSFGWSNEQDLEWSFYVGARFHDPIAQGFGKAWLNAGSISTYVPDIVPEVFAFLFYDPSVSAADLHDQPLDQRFTDQQAVIFRSDASDSPLIAGLKSGPFTGEASYARFTGKTAGVVGDVNFGHDHADDNGVYIEGYGAHLLPEASGYNAGVGNGHPHAEDTHYHNALLVDGAGELGDERATDDLNACTWAASRSAGIPRGGSTADYAYAVGDGAHLYPSALGLTRFDRQMLVVNRQYVVVRDVVDASAPHTFTQAWHFLDGASSASGWIAGEAKSGARLGVRVVEPASYGFATSTLTPDNVAHEDPDGAITEADVSTPAAATSARMLSVLWPSTDATWANRPTVTPLSGTAGAGFVLTSGAHVDEVLLHDSATDSSTEGDLGVTGLGGALSLDDGTLTHAALLDGTQLTHGGNPLIQLPSPGTVEISVQGNSLLVTGEGVNQLQVFAPGVQHVFVNGHELAFALEGETAVVPPRGVAPGDASALSDATHPVWRAFDQASNVAWTGNGGWTVVGGASSTASTTSATSTGATSTTSSASSAAATSTSGTSTASATSTAGTSTTGATSTAGTSTSGGATTTTTTTTTAGATGTTGIHPGSTSGTGGGATTTTGTTGSVPLATTTLGGGAGSTGATITSGKPPVVHGSSCASAEGFELLALLSVGFLGRRRR